MRINALQKVAGARGEQGLEGPQGETGAAGKDGDDGKPATLNMEVLRNDLLISITAALDKRLGAINDKVLAAFRADIMAEIKRQTTVLNDRIDNLSGEIRVSVSPEKP